MPTNLRKQLRTRTLASHILLAVLGLFAIAFAAGCAIIPNQGNSSAPPPDFQPAAEVDLSSRSYDGETLMQFSLEETAVTGIFFTIENIDTPYFDLSLMGPTGNSFTILHSEDFRTDQHGSGQWEQNLPPGTYRLVLTALQSPGILSIYWGIQ